MSYAQPFRLSGFHQRIYFHEVEVGALPPYSSTRTIPWRSPPPSTTSPGAKALTWSTSTTPSRTHTSAWIAREMLGSGSAPPLVTTLHGTDVTLVGLHPSFRDITRFSIMRSQGVTAVSHFLKEVTVRDFRVPEERIQVVPNFVNTRTFRPSRDRSPPQRARARGREDRHARVQLPARQARHRPDRRVRPHGEGRCPRVW